MNTWLKFTPIGAGLIYLLVAIICRLGIDNPAVENAPLIGFIYLVLPIFGLMMFGLILTGLVLLVMRRYQDAAIAVINGVGIFFIIWIVGASNLQALV